MDHFTLDDLSAFTRDEHEWMKVLKCDEPSRSSVANVLAYSKALGSKHSSLLPGNYLMVLN